MQLKRKPFRILNFDCEARPLGWYAGDQTHKEITVIAWAWLNGDHDVAALTKDERTRVRMLRTFRAQYDQADMIVGHYIRKFDLPLVNAMLLEAGEPQLGRKLTQDTFMDLPKMHGVSKSQENLSAMFGITEDKVHMNVPAWREANRLTSDGIEGGKKRALFDVAQNMALRQELLNRGLLRAPRYWSP